MQQNFKIEPKSLTNPLTNDIFGMATSVDIYIQYSIGDNFAKGYFTLKDDWNMPLKYGNGEKDIDIADWGDDDSIMINRLCDLLAITIIE